MNTQDQKSTSVLSTLWRTVVRALCTLTAVLWVVAATVNRWLPWATKGTNTGALDDIIHTAGVLGAALCWLLAVAIALWQRKKLGDVRWLPMWLLVVLVAFKIINHIGGDHQEGQDNKAAIAGDRVIGDIRAESRIKEKVIFVYFMDFLGPPPDDEKLLKPVTRTPLGPNYISYNFGGGGPETTSARGYYSLNKPKRLRWYIWHIKKHGQMVKDKNGVEHFDDTLFVDPKVPVVVCEATIPIYESPLVQQIYSRNFREYQTKSWKVDGGSLIATFYGDGQTLTLTPRMGISQNDDLNEDILKHQHQGDCK